MVLPTSPTVARILSTGNVAQTLDEDSAMLQETVSTGAMIMNRLMGYRALGVAIGFVTLLALPATSFAAQNGVPNPSGGATDVTGTITAHQLKTPTTISGTSYDWEAVWSNATMPAGVLVGNSFETFVNLYGWSAATKTPTLFNYNLYQPLSTPQLAQA